MLNQNLFSSQCLVSLLLLVRQRVIFGVPERGLAAFMQVCQALVASIGQDPNVLGNVEFVVLEKLKIMLAPLTKSRRHHCSGFLVDDQLRFLGMSLLFAAVVPCLAFFRGTARRGRCGRSTGCSLASASITSNMVSLGWSAFLPGKRNFFERTKRVVLLHALEFE